MSENVKYQKTLAGHFDSVTRRLGYLQFGSQMWPILTAQNRRLYMPPAKLLPAAKVLEAFADCRRQSKAAKENGEIGPLLTITCAILMTIQ